MGAVRISAATFIALALYMLIAPIIIETTPSIGVVATAALGIGWYFALWAALVAAMVFIISWTTTGWVPEEHEAAHTPTDAGAAELPREATPLARAS